MKLYNIIKKDKVKLGEYLSKVYFRGNNKTKITQLLCHFYHFDSSLSKVLIVFK